MLIRDAEEGDLAGVTAIYNDAVAHTTAIWNETQVDLDNRRAWLADRRCAGYPVLVALDAEGAVLGYASFGDWRPLTAIATRSSIRSMSAPTSAAAASVGR